MTKLTSARNFNDRVDEADGGRGGGGAVYLRGCAPVPRVQIVAVEDALHLRDRAVQIPLRRFDTFRKAAREEARGAQGAFDL